MKSWPLLGGPGAVLTIVMTYLFMIWLGQRMMQDRKPINLKHLIIPYNFLLVGLSAYMFLEVSVNRVLIAPLEVWYAPRPVIKWSRSLVTP